MESMPEYRKSWLKLWSHIIVGNAYRPPAKNADSVDWKN